MFKHDIQSSVGIKAAWLLSPTRSTFFGMEMPSALNREMSLSLQLDYLASIDRIYMTQSTVHLDQGEIKLRKKTITGEQAGRSYQTSVHIPISELIDKSMNHVRFVDSSIAKFHVAPPFAVFQELELEDIEQPFSPREAAKLAATQYAKIVEESLIRELANLHYIGPLRESPQRMYLSTGETPREVGIAGELGPAVLWSASKAKQLDSVKLSEWCKRMGLALEVRLARVQGGFFQILIVDMHTKVAVTLSDVGVGNVSTPANPDSRAHRSNGSNSPAGAARNSFAPKGSG